METFNIFSIHFNNNASKFLSLVYQCKTNVAILDKFDVTGASIFSFKKHAFADRVFTSMLI